MSDTQSDRSVLPFPAELRLKIYRNLVKKTYLALGTTPEHFLSAKQGDRKPLPPSAGLVILRVSKATSAEALKLLYEESVFLFKVDFTTEFLCDAPPQKAVALMNNVSIEISARIARTFSFVVYDHGGPTGPTGPTRDELMSQRTIELFTGTALFRNAIRIRYIDYTTKTDYREPSEFADATTYLAGFRKLVVEFEPPPELGSDKPKLTAEQARVVCQSECEKFKNSEKNFFEPIYGPAVQGTVPGACNYTCYLEFYPRQHLAKDLIAKAAEMLEEAARLAQGERAATSLPGVVETLKLL